MITTFCNYNSECFTTFRHVFECKITTFRQTNRIHLDISCHLPIFFTLSWKYHFHKFIITNEPFAMNEDYRQTFTVLYLVILINFPQVNYLTFGGLLSRNAGDFLGSVGVGVDFLRVFGRLAII